MSYLDKTIGSKINSMFDGMKYNPQIDDEVTVLDEDWISSRFMVPDKDLTVNGEDLVKDGQNLASGRYDSTATYKFTSGILGGNIGINPKPQYTRYADIRPRQLTRRNRVTFANNNGNHGMGRYYSEAIDDNAETIFMEFGKPEFNGIFNFYTSAIDYEESIIANTGRSTIAYNVGQKVGSLVMLAAFPMITLSMWGIEGISKAVFSKKRFDYYYLNPTMTDYWGTVSTIASQLFTELGILNPLFMDKGEATKKGINTNDKIGRPLKFNQDDIEAINELIPGLIDPDTNYVDVYKIATRAQSIANKQARLDREEYLNKLNAEEELFSFNYWKLRLLGDGQSRGSHFKDFVNNTFSLNTLLHIPGDMWDAGVSFKEHLENKKIKEVLNERIDEEKEKKLAAARAEEAKKNADTNGKVNRYTKDELGYLPGKIPPSDDNILTKFAGAMDATIRDGGMHAVFYVDYSGSVSESFNNSTSKIEANDKIKQINQRSRNLKFDLAGGNLVDGMDKVIQYGKELLAGGLDSVTFGLGSVVQAATGGGYIDLPLKWDDSSMNLPTTSYTMKLISPYGNVYSQIQNIYLPICMLLAGALPIATGKNSYTSPYLCSLFNKGKQNIELGMITSLTLTRGTSNLGWSKNRRPLAIDVSFTVTDFSTIMTAPVNGSIFNVFSPAIDDNNTLGRYLAVMGSRDLLTSKYTYARTKLRVSKALKNLNRFFNPTRIGMVVGEPTAAIFGGLTSSKSLTLQYQN